MPNQIHSIAFRLNIIDWIWFGTAAARQWHDVLIGSESITSSSVDKFIQSLTITPSVQINNNPLVTFHFHAVSCQLGVIIISSTLVWLLYLDKHNKYTQGNMLLNLPVTFK